MVVFPCSHKSDGNFQILTFILQGGLELITIIGSLIATKSKALIQIIDLKRNWSLEDALQKGRQGKGLVISIAQGLTAADLFQICKILCFVLHSVCVETVILAEAGLSHYNN